MKDHDDDAEGERLADILSQTAAWLCRNAARVDAGAGSANIQVGQWWRRKDRTDLGPWRVEHAFHDGWIMTSPTSPGRKGYWSVWFFDGAEQCAPPVTGPSVVEKPVAATSPRTDAPVSAGPLGVAPADDDPCPVSEDVLARWAAGGSGTELSQTAAWLCRDNARLAAKLADAEIFAEESTRLAMSLAERVQELESKVANEVAQALCVLRADVDALEKRTWVGGGK